MTPQMHQSFSNYIGPSTAKESSISVEGFQKSKEMHGVLYHLFFSDDDSVFAQLKEKFVMANMTINWSVKSRNKCSVLSNY